MQNINPLISVIMPTYNNGKYIKQAIESIYAQNYDNIEIIVVDDGSTDNTKEILKEYKNIKYFYIRHKGIPFARNLAIENSNGEYIAFCDSDDYWLPEKINTQIQYFKEHPDCEIVFTKYENFFERKELKICKKAVLEKELEKADKKYLPSALIKKSIFKLYGNFDEKFQTGEDTEFIYRISENGTNVSHFVDTIFYIRRLHGNNITLIKNTKYSNYIMNLLRKRILNK